MFIQTEDTQEINTLRFLPGVEVSPVTTQLTKADAGRSPLADKIFDLENITRVTFGTYYIQVTKTDDAEWHTLRPQILASIMEHFMAGLPVINDTEQPSEVSPDQTEELSGPALEIQEIVNTRIRPAAKDGGGDVSFKVFKGGIADMSFVGLLHVLMQPIHKMV